MFELIKILEKLNSQKIKKSIVVLKDNKEFSIDNFYIMDETFYLEMTEKKDGMNSSSLLYYLECEAEDECWQDNVYRSSMSRIMDCDAKLITEEDLDNDRFENSVDFKIIENENSLILEVL